MENSLNNWNKAYKNNTHMSVWPWSDVVSYTLRYIRPQGKILNVLELGCGAGANIPFFLNLKTNYFGIDGSQLIVKQLQKRYPIIKTHITAGDFTKEIPFNEKFDLILDRAALTHNTSGAIAYCVNHLIKKILKKGGSFIGLDWFSTKHSDYLKGQIVGKDQYSRTNYLKGQFSGLGIVHFTNKSQIMKIFKDFKIEVLEHKINKRVIPSNSRGIFASWNILAVKK